jgi:hypothetical protein
VHACPNISLYAETTEFTVARPHLWSRKPEVHFMTMPDLNTRLEEPPQRRTPANASPQQILVWRQPKLFWFAFIIAFGLGLPGFMLYRLEVPIGFGLALPAACVATFIGLLLIEIKPDPIENDDVILFTFLKCGGWLIAGLSLMLGPFFPIGIIVGLVFGLPWAIWVSVLTTTFAMTWRKPN